MRERCICGAEWERTDLTSIQGGGWTWQEDRQAWRDTHPCDRVRSDSRITKVEYGSPLVCSGCGQDEYVTLDQYMAEHGRKVNGEPLDTRWKGAKTYGPVTTTIDLSGSGHRDLPTS